MKYKNQKQVDLFLHESNAIERAYDTHSFKLAQRAWAYLIGQKVLTVAVVLKTHKILSKGSNLPTDAQGFFRRVGVRIGSRYGMKFPLIPEAMESWVKDVATSVEHPGEDGKNIKIDHITYEEIHPFQDFNGRTGRMFMNWQRVKVGLPILVIKESEKGEYYRWFGVPWGWR